MGLKSILNCIVEKLIFRKEDDPRIQTVKKNSSKRGLSIGNTDPYDGKPMDGAVAHINGKWTDKYAGILNKKGVKHLFLNTAWGWTCDNYDFLPLLNTLESFFLLDGRDISIKQVESLKCLRTLELTVLHCDEIDFSVFKCLETLSCYADKPIPSVFQCTSLKDLSLSEFRMGDNHQISQLYNLENLYISGYSNLTNLEFLRSLPKLRKLSIYDNRHITDFSPISSLKHLNWIDLRGLKNLHSIDFLENLMELNVLLLECGTIESIHPISNHQELKAISIAGSKFSIKDGDLSPIETLNNLSMLFIRNKRTHNARVNNLWNWDNYGKTRHDWIKH